MISFSISFLGILLGTSIPAYAGLLAAVAIGGSRPRYLAAFSIGIFLWFFSDTIGGSSYLGVNSGLSGGPGHLALVALFALGLIAFFLAGGQTTKPSYGDDDSAHLLIIPVLVAIALSIHGLGEGLGFGDLASSTSSTSLIQAFGGYGPAASYILHKFLEPTIIGACYAAFSLRLGIDRRRFANLKSILMIGTLFILPTLIGTAAGYYLPFDTTYVFAAAAGAAVYVLFKLSQAIFEGPNQSGSRRESLRVGIFALLGFLLIYAAAIFHSVV